MPKYLLTTCFNWLSSLL